MDVDRAALEIAFRIAHDGYAAAAGRDLGAKHALGKVVDPYKPANEDPVLFLDWNTVHEAGHAVDEKYRFMASRAGQEAFGGWTEYGMDTARVAAKLKDAISRLAASRDLLLPRLVSGELSLAAAQHGLGGAGDVDVGCPRGR